MCSLLVTYIAFTLAVTSTLARPSFIETDSIVFPDGINDTVTNSISDKFKQCLKDNFKIEYNGECRALLTTENSCANDQWLILNYTAATQRRPVYKGQCVKRLCPPQKHFWVESNRCVFSNESVTLCPRGNTINTDYFGEGVCECVANPVQAKDRSGACYAVFTRGPCREDGVWVQVHGQAECRADHCSKMRTSLPNKVVVPWPDLRCYVVDDRGPCNQGFVVSVNVHTFTPECVNSPAPLHLLNPPCSGTDHSGRCAASVNTPANQFQAKVTQYAANKGQRTNKG